jgi:exopolysaccharide biosynthesis operon protein EpsL
MRLKRSTNSLPSFRRTVLAAALLQAGIVACASAYAEEADTRAPDVLRPFVGISVTHDDNFLGVTDDAIALPAIDPRHADKASNITRRVDAGVAVDKTVGLQRFTANVDLYRMNYNSFGNLDHDGRDIAADWNWHVGPHVDGHVGLTDSRDLAPFTEFHTADQNMRNQDRQYVDAGWQFHPSWKVYGGLSHYRLSYDVAPTTAPAIQAALKGSERTVNDGDLGLDFVAKSGSSVGLQYRHAKGSLSSAANSYTQDEFKGKVDWKYSVKTELQFLGGYTRWRTDGLGDFQGFNARATAYWSATRKLTFNAALWREVSAVDELFAAFALVNGESLGVNWDLLEKVKLGFDYQHQNRDYTISGATLAGRQDTYNYGAFTLTYLPTLHWKILASIYRTKLGSNVPFTGYSNTGASLGTRYEF